MKAGLRYAASTAVAPFNSIVRLWDFDMYKNSEISMRQHLEALGWGERYLDDSGRFARLGVKKWSSCLEPFSRLQRILTRKRLPITEIISPGVRVKFLRSLKHEIVGSGPIFSIFGLFVRIMSFISGRDVTNQPMFMGLIEEQHDFDQFPFDEWLTVASVRSFDTRYNAPDGRIWTVNHIALTNVTQVEISQQLAA